jgi:hypothetical protein
MSEVKKCDVDKVKGRQAVLWVTGEQHELRRVQDKKKLKLGIQL